MWKGLPSPRVVYSKGSFKECTERQSFGRERTGVISAKGPMYRGKGMIMVACSGTINMYRAPCRVANNFSGCGRRGEFESNL